MRRYRAVTYIIPRLTLARTAALFAVLFIALLLRTSELGTKGIGHYYYGGTVLSMMQSPSNFVFGAAEPGGSITVDKPPLGFMTQAVAAWIFGFNWVSLALPGVISGVLTTTLVHAMIARRFGFWPGTLAALVVAVTPVSVALDRTNLIDSQDDPRTDNRRGVRPAGHRNRPPASAAVVGAGVWRGVQHQDAAIGLSAAAADPRVSAQRACAVGCTPAPAGDHRRGLRRGRVLVGGRRRPDAAGQPAVYREQREQLGIRPDLRLQRLDAHVGRDRADRRANRVDRDSGVHRIANAPVRQRLVLQRRVDAAAGGRDRRDRHTGMAAAPPLRNRSVRCCCMDRGC
ncbi:MAG: hypothetical protein HND48_18900 [Chloroflexi bacterium]|nr:hypothetical protein [Chloroflexota bacterium]